MRDTPYTEAELDELNKTREGIREYYTTVATQSFQRANAMSPGQQKKIHLNIAMIIFQNMDAFVESAYKMSQEKD